MTMTWSPAQRAEYLAEVGAESPFLREWRDRAYRSGARQLGEPGPVAEVVNLWHEPVVIPVERTDVEASYRAQRVVRSVDHVNLWCLNDCGGEAIMPAAGEGYLCWGCWSVEKADLRDAQADAAVAGRTAVLDLPDLLSQYDRPGGLGNRLLCR